MSDLTLENERKLHQEIISDKDRIIAALRQDYARLNKSHAKDMSILVDKHRSLTNENENYKARNASLLGDKRDIMEQLRVAKTETNSVQQEMKHLAEKNRSLTNEYDNYKAENASPLKEKLALIDQLENVKAERNSAQKEVENLTQKHLADQQKINRLDDVITNCYDLNQALENEVTKLKAQIVGLRHDNDEIRSYILKMERELPPVVDDYYIQLFEEIKSEVEIWSAKHGKSNAGATLSQEHEDQLLDIIARLGNSGIASVDFLRANPQSFRTWYSNARSRIQLVRHVIASFLYDKIFEPFAAGLPSQLWQALVGITGYVIEDGFSPD
jgi:chromosome segregation ATPase